MPMQLLTADEKIQELQSIVDSRGDSIDPNSQTSGSKQSKESRYQQQMKDILWDAVSNQQDFRRLLSTAAQDLNQGTSSQQISSKLSTEISQGLLQRPVSQQHS